MNKTKTNLSKSKNSRTFTDEELENLDMSNIKFAISVNVLKKYDVELIEEVEPLKEGEVLNIGDSDDKEIEETLAEIPTVDTNSEEIIFQAFTESGEPRCQAITGDGSQCEHAAKYPEDDPIYCGIHKSKIE